MARYIDADVLIKKIYPMGIGDGMYTINAKAVKFAIDNAPTADVVPRAEAENYKSIAEYQQNLSMDRYFEIKQLKQELDKAKGEVIEEYRQRVNVKMGKHTHLLGKEYVQRILREVAKEMKGGAE